MSEYPRAVVREINGQLVLDDPDALAMIKVIAKRNCRVTLEANADRVEHFKQRIVERNMSPEEVVIIIANANDVHGGPLADSLVSGADWQAIRDRGEIPFARGLAMREGIQELMDILDKDTGNKLRQMKGVAIVVVDHGVAEIFSGSNLVVL